MFEKYIMIKDNKIIVGQNASNGTWYCKELPCDNAEELELSIGKVNKILNQYNNSKKEKTFKEKNPEVKGLD